MKFLVRLLARSVAVLSFIFASTAFADPGIFPFSINGDLKQGGLVRATIAPGASVSVDGRELILDASGNFIFGFDRDHDGTADVSVTFADGKTWAGAVDIATRDYDIQRVEGIAKKYVEPPAETLARIREEAKRKRAARKEMNASTGYLADFSWPLTGRISGVYGSQRFYNGKPGRPHFGLDIAAPAGTNFHAPADGVVTLADDDMYFEGGLIFLDHGLGLTSAFLHLSGVDVKPGDVVKQGDVLGRVGAAGRANGPHLDWRMYWFDQHIDPAFLVGSMPVAMAK